MNRNEHSLFRISRLKNQDYFKFAQSDLIVNFAALK